MGEQFDIQHSQHRKHGGLVTEKERPGKILMYIFDNESGDGFDVSTLVHSLSYTSSLQGQPGKLTFQLEKDLNGVLQMSLGSVVYFMYGETKIFYGYIFKIDTDRSEVFSVTAYDQLRYFQNHDYYAMSDKSTMTDVFKYVCNSLQVKYEIRGKAETNSYQLDKHIFNDESYFDIMQWAMDQANVRYYKKEGMDLQTGKSLGWSFGENVWGDVMGNYFFMRDEFGTIVLNDIATNVTKRRILGAGDVYSGSNETFGEYYYYNDGYIGECEPLIMGDGSLMTDYRYSVDIDTETANEVFLLVNKKDDDEKQPKASDDSDIAMQNGETLRFSQRDDELVKKWGVLRRVETLDSKFTQKSVEDYGKLMLALYSTPTKTLKLNALGMPGMMAGDGFWLRIPRLNVDCFVFVMNVQHDFNGDSHTMNIEVATPRSFAEVLR